MNPLHELAAQVTLGTERRPPVLPQLTGPLADLIAAACPNAPGSGLDAPDPGPEVRVLRAAGVMAVCADAGFMPSETAADLPPPCPSERLSPVTDPQLAAALQRIVTDSPDALRHEAFRQLAGAAACLPPGVLPRALALARKTPALREALLPVLGERGHWLARSNPEWSYAVAVAAADGAPQMDWWEHGTGEQRKALLRRLRQTDPPRARSLLQEGFADLDARERADLLGQLVCGLAPADEAFLETALGDRSKEVRQLAGQLLARLPGSRYGERMATRLVPCLGRERKLFRQVLTLDAPAQFGAGWKSDALDESRAKNESLGERAWWLYQLARAVPLAWWPTQTGLAPAALVDWLLGTDWSEAVLRAWSEALRGQPDAALAPAFASALLAKSPQKGLGLDAFELLAFLPVAEREPHWLRLLGGGHGRIALGDLLGRIAQSLALDGPGLSAGFAARMLNEARAAVQGEAGKTDFALRRTLPDFVCLIPAACLDDARRGWPAGRPDADYFSDSLARLLDLVELRAILHRSFS